MTPIVLDALSTVGRVMRDTRRPWWIVGSGAVALLGADPGEVHDIDVLVDGVDADLLFTRLGLTPLTLAPDPLFRSEQFAKWHAGLLPVEFMVGFAVRSDAAWWPVVPRSREMICVEGEDLFVPERAELVALLRRMGRPKDLIRAMILEGREPG